MVECHGGAWCMSDRMSERQRHEFMASHGIVSIALDFRSGNEDPYPASVQDINYAVRWAKANARSLKTRPELIGLSGQSSGGHLAMLVAMRPNDPRYTAIALPAGTAAAGCERSLRGHVLAGDQSARRAIATPSARWRAATNGARPSFRAMTPTGASKPTWQRAIRCWRSSVAKRSFCRRRSGSRAGRYRARLQGCRVRISPATSRSASAPTTRRPAAISRSNISRWIGSASHSPDLSKTGDMFARMVQFIGKHIRA